MTSNYYDIQEYSLKQLPIHISYTVQLEQMLACAEMGMTYNDYLALPGTPEWALDKISKCEVLVSYRMKLLIRAVAEDAAIKDADRGRR